MSSTPPIQSRIWPHIAPCITPIVAASAAIIPVFYGFIAKSALQIGMPAPKMTAKDAALGGIKASPTVGIIIGTQMLVQNLVEKVLIKNSEKPTSTDMLASSIITGAVSAPALAVFNGQTTGLSVIQSLKSLSLKQTGALVSRETSFLFSLRISGPISDSIKRRNGDNKAVEYSAAFVTGVVGSIIGHPADTALTLWQKELQVSTCKQLMRGVFTRALAIGGFSVLYKAAKENLQAL